ncbi:lectin-like domain-containing protein [Apilactobacillus kunkeei]|uniref:lectin-like domain-containing protein n=1 Tax=Apilactobacillus kunkeei TaxID=148814 RepID=UPI0039E0D72F
MNKETKEKKILHKVKKNWVVIGMATVSLLGTGYAGLHNDIVPVTVVANADDNLSDKGPVTININKDDFLNYFHLIRDASYDQNTGVITLTPDAQIKTGGVSLKNKISMNRSFVLKGSIYAGDKLDSQGGADGLAIFLHPNSVNTPVNPGGSAGMWGIPNAVGFKVDTFYNKRDDDPLPANDNVQYDGEANAPFAAFTYTNANGVSEKLKNEPTVQWLNTKNFLNKDAKFMPFVFSYDSDTRTFTVNFDDKTWTQKYTGNDNNMVLVISAATGLSHNLQQVQLDSFSYSAEPLYLDQQNAMDDLNKTANNTTDKINGDDKLSSDQKNNQNQKVSDELQKSLDNVQQQTTSDGVTKAQEDGKKSIENQYVPGSQLNPESSSAQSSSASSSAQSSAESSKAESSAQSSTENSSAQSSAESSKAESSAQSSTENSSAQSSAESSKAASSAQSSTENSSAQSSSESSKAESSAQSSTENSSAQSSAESSKAESSAQSSAENSSAQSSSASSSAESSAESSKAESSAQSSTENSSAQSSAESSKAESSAQSSTENSSAQSSTESSKAASSAQSSTENSSAQSSAESSKAENSAQSSAENSSAQSLSASSSAESSAESSKAASSAQSSTESSSAQSSAESSKAASSAQSSAENSSAQNSSASTHETRHHESNASNSLANNKDAKRLPQTGDQTHENVLVAVGTSLIALALGLAFVASRRRRKH